MKINGAGGLVGGWNPPQLRRDEVRHHLGVSAFASHAVVDRSSVVVIDNEVPLPIAVHHTAGVRAGESAVVFGLGGVGLAAVMSAAAGGAYPVVAVDPIPGTSTRARSRGDARLCT